MSINHLVSLCGQRHGARSSSRRASGVRVPPGFVVTTHAYRATLRNKSDANAQLVAAVNDALAAVVAAEQDNSAATSTAGELRWAVRSSATGEDGSVLSFAGQHDSFLNIETQDVVENVHKCFESLQVDFNFYFLKIF